MKPRALAFDNATFNPENLGNRDLRAFSTGLELAGYEVDRVSVRDLYEKLDEYPIEEYDLIAHIPQMALHASTVKNYKVITEVYARAKDDVICIPHCDSVIKIEANIWDPRDRAGTRHNYLSKRPVRFVISYADEIFQDPEAIAQLRKGTLREAVHPSTDLVAAQWNVFHYELSQRIGALDFSSLPEGVEPQRIAKFYYGVDKPKLKPSLLDMGFGDSPDDALFGRIGKLFPAVRNLQVDSRKSTREHWVPHTALADEVLVPYDPVKSEYQVTLRLLEALEYYPGKAIFDPRVSEWMRPFAMSSDPWLKLQEAAAKDLRALS